MKIFLLLICFCTTIVYSQSKKEQIEYLNLQLDSNRTIQIKVQQLANTREAELNVTILKSLELEVQDRGRLN